MFWTIAAILFVLWVMGMLTGSTAGLWVHLLLLFSLASLILAVATTARFAGKHGGRAFLPAPPRPDRRPPVSLPRPGA